MNSRTIIDGTVTDLDMAALIASRDWAQTPVGPSEDWPQSLKTIVSIIVDAPLAMIVLWGPSLVQIYNSAYAEICGSRHPAALGQPTRECWPEVWTFNAPIYEAVHRGEVRAFERQPLTILRDGVLQEAWFDLTYSPARDESGAVAGVLVTVVEVTHHVQIARMTANAVSEGERMRVLFERAPGFIAILKGPEHVFEFANHAYMRLVGDRQVLGRSVRDVVPEIAEQGFVQLLDDVYATGVLHEGLAVPLRLDGRDGGLSEDRFVDFLYAPMVDANGKIDGVLLQGMDVTDRTLAQERQTLLNNELNHRVKNTLATVLSLAMLARKSATCVEAFTQSFTDRIGAMALTHDLLTSAGWMTVPVRKLLDLELAPYVSDRGQVRLQCDDVNIAATAAVNLSLIVHELLTNAAKYGALSTPEGVLSVICQRSEAGAVLTWTEDAGHALRARGVEGFGTRLIKRLATGLGGGARIEFRPSGLHAVITFAVESEDQTVP